MRGEEWLCPPVDPLLDYVPTGARPFYVEQWREMVEWLNHWREVKYWDPARIGSDGSRRVPDVTCTHPRTGVEYVVDARIFWNSMSEGPTGYTAYSYTGWGAARGEQQTSTSDTTGPPPSSAQPGATPFQCWQLVGALKLV